MKKRAKDDISKYILFLFIILLPFSWVSSVFGSVYRTFVIVLTTGCLILYGGKLRFAYEKKKIVNAWVLYCGFSIISILWSGFSAVSINTMLGMMLLFAVSLCFFTIKLDIKGQKIMDYCWGIGGILFVLLFLSGETVNVGSGTRQTLLILGTPTDPNEFASYFAIAIPLSLYWLFRDKNKIIKWLYAVVIVGGIYVVLMSGSRGAMLSVALSSLVAIVIVGKMSPRKILIFVIALGVLLLLVQKYLLPLIPEGTLERFSLEMLSLDKGSGRAQIWENGLRKFWNGSVFGRIFGYGYGGLVVDTGLSYMSKTTTMHNQILQQITCYGIAGVILYLRLIYLIFIEFIRNKKQYIAPFIGMMIMGMTITMGPSYKILWILFFQAGVKEKDIDMNAE